MVNLGLKHFIAVLSIVASCFGIAPGYAALDYNRYPAMQHALPFTVAVKQNSISVDFDLIPGASIFEHSISVTNLTGFTSYGITYPVGIEQRDSPFVKDRILKNRFSIEMTVADVSQQSEFILTYQGCYKDIICYRPQARLIKVMDEQWQQPYHP